MTGSPGVSPHQPGGRIANFKWEMAWGAAAADGLDSHSGTRRQDAGAPRPSHPRGEERATLGTVPTIQEPCQDAPVARLRWLTWWRLDLSAF